jgi:hypothetical protein
MNSWICLKRRCPSISSYETLVVHFTAVDMTLPLSSIYNTSFLPLLGGLFSGLLPLPSGVAILPRSPVEDLALDIGRVNLSQDCHQYSLSHLYKQVCDTPQFTTHCLTLSTPVHCICHDHSQNLTVAYYFHLFFIQFYNWFLL